MLIEVLNFGASKLRTDNVHPTWQQEPDMVVTIPEIRNLEPVPYRWAKDYPDPSQVKVVTSTLKPFKSKETYNVVIIPLMPNVDPNQRLYEVTNNMILIRSNTQSKWVAVGHHMWRESDDKYDERYEGPFQLDDFCKHVVSQVDPSYKS